MSVNCTVCENEGNPASSFCVECDEFLCIDCTTYHGRMKKTKYHNLQSPQQELNRRENQIKLNGGGGLKISKCGIHKDQEFTKYCVECDEEICSVCTELDKHLSHELLNLDKCVEEFKEMLKNSIPEFTSCHSKTREALLDLESKIRNTVGPEKVKLLTTCRSHINKIQITLLERELDIRKDIVKQTIGKAKELNIKRSSVQLLQKKTCEILEMVPKYIESDPYQLFSNRRLLTKDYFYLREHAGILLDDKKYREYVECDWYFHIGDGVLLETIMDLKALGSFVYTNGLLTQDNNIMTNINPVVSVPVKSNSIESIFKKKYHDENQDSNPKGLKEDFKKSSNGDLPSSSSTYVKKIPNLEMEELETSVENEYIGFDILKELKNTDKIPKENPRFSPGTTLASLLDEKVKDHPEESYRLSKYIAEKTNIGVGVGVDDGNEFESNSEYDPVLQTAKGIDLDKRRRTHSEESIGGGGVSNLNILNTNNEKRRGRKQKIKPKPGETTPIPQSQSQLQPQPTRKSSRFEVSPRPGLAVLPKSSRRIPKEDKEKDKDNSPEIIKNIGGRNIGCSTSTSTKRLGGRGSVVGKRNDSPPHLTREVFLYNDEIDELIGSGTPNESEDSHGDGDGDNQSKEKSTLKKRKVKLSSDEDYVVGNEKEEKQKNKSTPSKRKKDPFLQSTRKRKINRKKVIKKKDDDESIGSGNLKMDLFIEKMKISNYDENEDYCTVCLDGGENLICCDNCPKVFHIQCHLPALHRIPTDDWQCIFCIENEKLDSYTQEKESTAVKSIIFPPEGGLNEMDFIIACKFIADIYGLKSSLLIRGFSQKEFNLNPGENSINLNIIRSRLTLNEGDLFKSLDEVYNAVVEINREAGILYSESSEYGSFYKEFLEGFENVCEKYFPKIKSKIGIIEKINDVEEGKDDVPPPLSPPPIISEDNVSQDSPLIEKSNVEEKIITTELKEIEKE